MADIKCNVCECVHNNTSENVCKLSSIEVTHEKTGPNSIPVPHYCKTYTNK